MFGTPRIVSFCSKKTVQQFLLRQNERLSNQADTHFAIAMCRCELYGWGFKENVVSYCNIAKP